MPDVKLCECGCGEPAPIAKLTDPRCGHVAGEHVRYVSGHNMRGRKFSAEHRLKLSEVQKGRKFSAEHRAKLSASQRGRKCSEEHKAKLSVAQRGPRNNNWKGGRTLNSEGYVLLRALGHPHANSSGYVCEHRLCVEAFLGRYLSPEEVVHHIDGDKQNNALTNLDLFENQAAHLQHHRELARADAPS